MSQEETGRMLDTVAWANRRLERMGLKDAVAFVVTDGKARLLSASGRVLLESEGEDAATELGFLVFQFERNLFAFFENRVT